MMKLETITRTIVGLGIAAVCATAQTRADQPCDDCGPGENWIDECVAGTDNIPSSKAEVGIYLTADCTGTPNNFVLFGPATVTRKAVGDPIAGEIETEITEMRLEGGWGTLIVGAGLGQPPGLQPSLGTIDATGDPRKGFSSFEVFLEFYAAGIGYVYNYDRLLVQAYIFCVPPQAEYIHPEGQCIKLYNADGVLVAYLGDALHETFPCGDDIREGDEQCDGTDDAMCPGYCLPDCTCPDPICGNNATEAGEECDGTDDSACPSLCEPDCMCPAAPALPIWGIVGLGVLLAGGGATAVARRRKKA